MAHPPEPTGMFDHEPQPPEPGDQVPRHTTPTWEMELLISGAAVFAMLQFPAWLGDHLLPLRPRFGVEVGAALVLIYGYLASAAAILGIAFTVHLILRARWIALVGVNSVFPDGVRWERLRMGPLERRFSQQHDRGAAASIERADNQASVVFAFGVMLALLLLVLSIGALALFVITLALSLAGNQMVDVGDVLLALVALGILPLLAAKAVDHAIVRRAREGGIMHRAVARVYAVYRRLGLVRGFSIGRVLESHAGSRRFGWLTAGVLVPVIFSVLASSSFWQSPTRLGSYAWFPHFRAGSANAIAAAHYDDQRDPLRGPVVAYIPSEVISGPYLELTVPYTPAIDGRALRRHCPAAQAASGAARAMATLHCLATLHAVTLDGKALPDLRYDVASDPRSQRPALQAMIDVRQLAAGRHQLRVAHATTPGTRDNDGTDAAWVITFWR